MTDVWTRDEEQERRHLAETRQLLTTELECLTGSVDKSARTVQEHKQHMWNNLRDMDFAEKANFRESVNMSVALGEHAVMNRERVERLLDSNQSVNPFSASSLSTIHSMFPEADCLELCKSYRSTTEIADFAQNISRNDKLVPIARHGRPPQVIACADQRDQQARILNLIERHRHSDHRSLGIVCKTVAQARTLHRALSEAGVESTFLDYDSTAFAGGIVVTSAHISKGLEFDAVIVPQTDDTNYANEMDRSMLYIACTRAMHELYLTHDEHLSRFLAFAGDAAVDTETAQARVG